MTGVPLKDVPGYLVEKKEYSVYDRIPVSQASYIVKGFNQCREKQGSVKLTLNMTKLLAIIKINSLGTTSEDEELADAIITSLPTLLEAVKEGT